MSITFDHRDTGTSEVEWAASPRLAALAPLDLTGLAALVVVAAHPDDESLGAGGLTATVAAAGVRVDVLVATHGEASHPRSPTHTGAQLAALRAVEVRSAVAALAPGAHLHQLDLPDGALAAHESELACALSPLVDAGTWVAVPWRGDAHPDHAAVARAAAVVVAGAAGARLLEFPVWAWHWADPVSSALPWAAMRALALPPAALAAKARAMAAHRSQVEPLSDAPGDEAIVPPWFAEHFARDVEVFVVDDEARGPGGAP